MTCQILLQRTETFSNLDHERASLYTLLGWNSITVGDHKKGRAAAEAAIALARKVNDAKTLVRAYGVLALACVFLGDFAVAQEVAVEGEAIARQHGSAGELGLILSIRAQITFFGEGDIGRTKAYLEEAVSIAEDTGYRWNTSMGTYGMARIAGAMGDLATARAKFMESARIANNFGNKRIGYSNYSELAHVLREHGELDEPLSIYRELLPKWKELGHRAAVAHELECIAYILVKKEHPRRAATLLGAADSLRKLIDSAPTPAEQVEYEKELAALREKINESEFIDAWEQGKNLGMDEAIALATKEE